MVSVKKSDLENSKVAWLHLGEQIVTRTVIRNMIRETDFFDEEIASLVGVEEKLVEGIRALMMLDDELEYLDKPITDANREQMISTMVNIRVRVRATDLNDEQIAAQAGVSVNMVKRIRKFLFPRPSNGCMIVCTATVKDVNENNGSVG